MLLDRPKTSRARAAVFVGCSRRLPYGRAPTGHDPAHFVIWVAITQVVLASHAGDTPVGLRMGMHRQDDYQVLFSRLMFVRQLVCMHSNSVHFVVHWAGGASASVPTAQTGRQPV